MNSIILLILMVLGFSSGDEYRIFLDQPHDFEQKAPSYSGARGAGVKIGDDYRPYTSLKVESATFWMIGTWPDIPENWSFYVHRTSRNHQWYNYAPEYNQFYRMIGASSVRDLGEWNDDPDLHLFEVTFDNIGLTLHPGVLHDGIFWFSPDGFVYGEESWGRWVPYQKPGWIPLGDDDFPSTDCAMRIEGHLISDNVPPDAVLTEFELLTGILLDGELFDIRHTDSRRITLLTLQQPTRHNPRVKYIVRAISLVEDPDFIDLTIAQTLDANQGDSYLSLYNWRTQEYDPIRDYPLGRSENTIPIRDIPAADYINEDNEIELLVENVAETLTTQLTTATESTINRDRFDLRRAD